MGRKFFVIVRRLVCMLGGVCILAFSSVQAATVTDAYDQTTSLVVSVAANHKFVFTTPSGADEGDTIVLTFAPQFDTSSITEDDIDIADDGADLTTEAGNCTGTAQVGVVVTSDVLTMTICVGDGGAIAVGSVVTVEIGTNASASGSGTNRITNPSAAATYYVKLNGTFGDSASFPYPITTQGSGNVSGTVTSTEPSGGDGPDPAPDPNPEPEPTPEPEPEPEPDPDPEPEPTPEPTTDPEPAPTDSTTPTDTGSPTTPDSSSGGNPTSGTSDGDSETDGGTSSGDDDDNGEEAETEEESSGGTSDVEVDTVIVVDGGLTLSPDGDTFEAIVGTETTIVINADGNDIKEVRIVLEGKEYVLVPVDGGYATRILVPDADAALTVEVTHANGDVTQETYDIDVQSGGLVYEMVDGERVTVADAVVTVYEVRGGARIAWDASMYGASNPVISGASGGISWYVPNGTYIVTVGKAGYEDATSSQITVRNHILAPFIAMTRVTEEDVVAPSDEMSEPEVPMTAVASAVATMTAVTDAVSGAIASIREIPQVQVASDIAAPTTVVLATTSVAVLASSFNLLPFLQYLFTSPILFFARRKRKAFGLVYNAATKLPIDLAIVRLFSMPEHKLVRSVVTDAKGHYLLTVAPGRYVVEVMKPNFTCPSTLLQGKKDDGTYLDVYTGQEIEVTEKDAVIAANIPLDPASTTELVTPRHVAMQRFLRTFQHVVALIGVLLALAVTIINPSLFAGIMAGVQIAVYFLVRRLAKGRKPKGWGIVYDQATRQPVGNAVVRLFEPTYNKLVETVLTDRFGRYAFLVGPSEYYVSYSKPGYTEKIVKPIDYREKHEPTALALDVPIEEAKEDV